jgi:hypothetical protein
MNWDPYISWAILLVAFPGVVIAWTWFWSGPADEWLKKRTGFYETTTVDYGQTAEFRISRPVRATRVKRVSGKPKARSRKRA